MSNLLAQAAQFAHRHIAQLPLVAHIAQRIISYALCREVRHQFLVLELVQGEVVARLADTVKMFHERNDTGIYLKLYVVRISGTFLRALVLVFKSQSLGTALWNDLGAQIEREQGNDSRTDHIGAHKPSETHSRTDHGNDFTVVRQLAGKENHTQEHEECAEEIAVIGNEVEIVVH